MQKTSTKRPTTLWVVRLVNVHAVGSSVSKVYTNWEPTNVSLVFRLLPAGVGKGQTTNVL